MGTLGKMETYCCRLSLIKVFLCRMFLKEGFTINSHVRVLDFVPARGNARFFQCLLDEDMIRRVPRQKTQSQTFGG